MRNEAEVPYGFTPSFRLFGERIGIENIADAESDVSCTCWDWVRPPPAPQSLRREEDEEELYRQTGYEELEGGSPARPLRIRFIPLERHYAA